MRWFFVLDGENRTLPAHYWAGRRGVALAEIAIVTFLGAVLSVGLVMLLGDDVRALFATADNALAAEDSTPASRPAKPLLPSSLAGFNGAGGSPLDLARMRAALEENLARKDVDVRGDWYLPVNVHPSVAAHVIKTGYGSNANQPSATWSGPVMRAVHDDDVLIPVEPDDMLPEGYGDPRTPVWRVIDDSLTTFAHFGIGVAEPIGYELLYFAQMLPYSETLFGLEPIDSDTDPVTWATDLTINWWEEVRYGQGQTRARAVGNLAGAILDAWRMGVITGKAWHLTRGLATTTAASAQSMMELMQMTGLWMW
jgi:hypothetical protein